jgi:hypothetical protein
MYALESSSKTSNVGDRETEWNSTSYLLSWSPKLTWSVLDLDLMGGIEHC